MKYDLSQILSWIDIHSEALNIEISGLCVDSRKVKPGDLFIALNGTNFHGMDFSYQVQRTGAKAILAESVKADMAKPKSRREPLRIPVIEIDDLGQKLGHIASSFFQNPSARLKITGITGTNGKTSCAWLLTQAWEKFGIKSGYIGTLGYGTPTHLKPLKNTTPSSLELQAIYAGFADRGITHVAMEASSHGLEQGRCNATQFDTVGFTNLSQDHLDYHITLDEYAAAKEKLFSEFNSTTQIINGGDFYGKQWLDKHPDALSFAIESEKSDYQAQQIKLSPKGIEFKLRHDNNEQKIQSGLLGQFNVENLLLVIACLHQQGHSLKAISDLVSDLQPVMGRMNKIVHSDDSPTIVVDYAHTPDALEQVLKALKQHKSDKIWCVFGCGGNRDKGKRPQMGHIAESYADQVIVTDDNPRFESSEAILNDILMGMNLKPHIIQDRREAIKYAIENASANDIVLIAGKGHENHQEVQGFLHPFDDKNVAMEVLEGKS